MAKIVATDSGRDGIRLTNLSNRESIVVPQNKEAIRQGMDSLSASAEKNSSKR